MGASRMIHGVLSKAMEPNKSLLERALEHFGAQTQVSKAIEEMAELITELARIDSNRGMNIKVIEEIADVIIMINQLKILFGEELVQSHIETKLKRLRSIIDQ
jgi:hypothetical protein